MSFMDVQGGFGQNWGLQSNLAQNAAMNQNQQIAMQQQAAAAAAQQQQLNNLYGPQGFGGQTAYYAGQGAAYGRGTGYYGDTGGGGDIWSQGTSPFNDYGLGGTYTTATGNVGQSPGMAPGFGGFNNPAVPQNPISWYVNGGFDPYNPATYGGSALQNVGTGYPGMTAPTGTATGGYDPKWGGTSSYPMGPQSSAAPDYSPSSLMYGSSGTNFDTSGYFEANPDALDAYRSGSWGISDPTQFAQAHFLAAHNAEGGWRSGWAPANNPNFNAAGYYEANPDALDAFASSGFKDPTAFAEQHLKDAHAAEGGGWRTGWAPSGSNVGFDAAEYYLANPDALQAFSSSGYRDPTAFAEQHFRDAHAAEGGGWRTGWAPNNPNFDAAGYYAANPDALNAFASSGYRDPTAFAEQHLRDAHAAEGGGWRTGWAPNNPDFDVQGYFAANPDALQAYGEGSWGINDPTRFAQAHLTAAHAAEGGGWRGGWMANSDPSFDTAGWFGAHPEAYQSYFDKSNAYTNPTAYAEMSNFQSPSNDYSTFQKGPSTRWQTSIPSGRDDPNLINAIYQMAGARGWDPASVAAVVGLETQDNPTNYWNPLATTGKYHGLTQMQQETFNDPVFGGRIGGLTWDQYLKANSAQQIGAYGDWLDKQGVTTRLNDAGIGSQSREMQAAMLQAAQFGPNATDWLTRLAGGDMSTPVTTSKQAQELKTTSIGDMEEAFRNRIAGWQ